MESVMKAKQFMRTPVRKLSGCVAAAKDRRLCTKPVRRRSRGGGGRSTSGRTPPQWSARARELAVSRSYQADLDRERKLREARLAQKKAERAAVRAHFRRKYRLSEDPADKNHLKFVGGKVSLPQELSKIIHPETKTKDEGYNLLSAFQGLSFSTAALTRGKHSKTPTPSHGDSCRVM